MARRIRAIKPEFFTNETIQALPVEVRYYLIGLWSYADDFGRGSANPGLIRGQIDALSDITRDTIEAYMVELEEAKLVDLYQADGVSYFQVVDWDYWQKIDRPTASRLPAPSNSDESSRVLASESREFASDSDDLDDTFPSDSWGRGEEREGVEREGVREGESAVESESEGGRGPAMSLPPSPFCSLHPSGTDHPCKKCGNARKKFDYWQAIEMARAHNVDAG